MPVRLIKRKAPDAADEKREQPPSPTELLLNTQSWVDEFRARKAEGEQSLRALLERSAA
ncbi:MAG TPA: hypothetical protein VLM38_05150 [Blastocatellia bacterium]|nr:hypothetical protein [Blastocatellia bacterium]